MESSYVMLVYFINKKHKKIKIIKPTRKISNCERLSIASTVIS